MVLPLSVFQPANPVVPAGAVLTDRAAGGQVDIHHVVQNDQSDHVGVEAEVQTGTEVEAETEVGVKAGVHGADAAGPPHLVALILPSLYQAKFHRFKWYRGHQLLASNQDLNMSLVLPLPPARALRDILMHLSTPLLRHSPW